MWQGGTTIMDKVIDGNIDPPHPLRKDYPLENSQIELFQHLQRRRPNLNKAKFEKEKKHTKMRKSI
jgi:NADH:ubiquinone oxidoreductase subunit C